MEEQTREYTALIWGKDAHALGVRDHFFARDRVEAMAYLREKYGDDAVISLTDVEASNRPR